jgi:predicted N-acetyltransferase YhbS
MDAFGDEGRTVAELALALIHDPSAQPVLTLVAEDNDEVIGSIIFSKVQIQGAEQWSACILAPLAVAGHRQRRGVGRQLVESGLDALREQGVDLVFVLGDPRYYRRYGFNSSHQVRAPYDLPYPEAWMALALQRADLASLSGQVLCARSLNSPEHW